MKQSTLNSTTHSNEFDKILIKNPNRLKKKISRSRTRNYDRERRNGHRRVQYVAGLTRRFYPFACLRLSFRTLLYYAATKQGRIIIIILCWVFDTAKRPK